MLIIIISRSSLKLGHVGLKTRSLGQQVTQVSDLGPLWPSCFDIFYFYFLFFFIIFSYLFIYLLLFFSQFLLILFIYFFLFISFFLF